MFLSDVLVTFLYIHKIISVHLSSWVIPSRWTFPANVHWSFVSQPLVQSAQDYVPKHGESCGPTSIRPSAPCAHDLHNKHSMDAQITDCRGSHAPERRWYVEFNSLMLMGFTVQSKQSLCLSATILQKPYHTHTLYKMDTLILNE